MVSSWSATSLCRAVFSLSSVLTLLLPKREPTLSAMLAAAVVAAASVTNGDSAVAVTTCLFI